MLLNFAENFKQLRKEKGVTQEKIAETFGVSSQSVSRWELSICYPDLELLPSIANYFGVTVDHLLSNDVPSKEKDYDIFCETLYTLDGTERIDFCKEYCRKYPADDYYAYQLVCAVKDYAVGDNKKANEYMPMLQKYVDRLLETRYRNATIQQMATMCDEKELDGWLAMAPYTGFSRRYCLIARAMQQEDDGMIAIQQGMEMLETFADQLDRRCPDSVGARKKTAFQRDVLKTIRSFGDGTVPDGWKTFYAYKQLVLAACLFGNGETEEGWEQFESAIEACKYAHDLQDEWLDIGGALFSDLKVSKDWAYVLDLCGNKHALFGIANLSFFDMRLIHHLLTDPRWAWFDSVRQTPRYRAAVEWVESVRQ